MSRAGRSIGVVAAAALVMGAGWRGDGTGRFPKASPPEDLSIVTTSWTTPLAGRGNAMPVVWDDLVCVTREPARTVCLDAATGAVRWDVATSPLDALDDDARGPAAAKVAAADAAADALPLAQQAYGRARRGLRAGRPEAAAEVQAAAAEVESLAATVREAAAWRVGPGDPTVGWATPTPVVAGDALCAWFAFGVATCFERDGTRRWAVDLGRPASQRRGYTGVPTASPRIAGDVLVVAHDTLHGLDLATGATRWEAGASLDFGTPSVADLEGLWVVATPDGRLVRARDGAVVAEGLGDGWYSGPVIVDDVLVRAGTIGQHDTAGPGTAWAFDLARDGDGVVATPRWSVPLPLASRVYADPLVADGAVVVVTRDLQVVALSMADGSVQTRWPASAGPGVEGWASPSWAGGRVWIPTDLGTLIVVPGLAFDQAVTMTLPPFVAAPVFAGGRVVVHHRDGVSTYGR